jgi:hypothetical protein
VFSHPNRIGCKKRTTGGKPEKKEEEDILFTRVGKRVEILTTKMGTDQGCRSGKIKWKLKKKKKNNFRRFSASLLFGF